MANPESYQFYQWYPAKFRADRRIRKLDGIHIAILRALHDVLWLSEDKQVIEDDIRIAEELDIPLEQWRTTKHRLIESQAIYRCHEFIRSPHTDDCWTYCEKSSAVKAKAANKRWENR